VFSFDRPAWHAHAACRGATALFYAEHTEGRRFDVYGPARAICAACPVREPCADAGRNEAHGVWAGLTPKERARLRRSRRAA
jgi:hypothetical protein